MFWKKLGVLACGLALGMGAAVACSSSNGAKGGSTKDSGVEDTGSPQGGGDGGLFGDAGSVNGYLQGLPGWPAALPDADVPTGDASTNNSVIGADNKTYSCTTTPYSLTSTPQQIVTFNPNADVLWPGALLQGKALQAGALAGLPITQRAPLAVSIPTLLAQNNTVTVSQPTVATVEQAIGQLIDTAVQANLQPSSSISYDETTAYSASQAALNVGLSLNYLGFSLSSTFNYSTDASLSTIVGTFTENMFTVAVPEPEQPGDLFSGLTQDELNEQIAAGNIGPDNLPVYVASVTYGRILMFSITSTESASNMQADLSAQYNGAGGGGGVNGGYQSLMTNTSTTIHVATIGGAASNAEAMIRTGDPTQFFTSDPPLTTAVPISYTLRNLGNNSIAAVSETTSYNVQTCQESSAGVTANFYVVSGGNSVVTFDSQGNPTSISNPIESDAGVSYGGIAYDFQDDELFVTTSTSGTPSISVFQSDGTPVSLPSANWALSEPVSQISYDPQYGRLYVVEPGADVKTFTTGGVPQVTYPLLDANSAVFDADDGWIFTSFTSAPFLQAYKLNGSLVPFSLASGVTLSAPVLGYDEHHDQILVADSTNLYALLPTGGLLASATLESAAAAITYDDNDDEVVVAVPGQSLVQVFTPDLAPVTLAAGAFRGLANPTGIAYRP